MSMMDGHMTVLGEKGGHATREQKDRLIELGEFVNYLRFASQQHAPGSIYSTFGHHNSSTAARSTNCNSLSLTRHHTGTNGPSSSSSCSSSPVHVAFSRTVYYYSFNKTIINGPRAERNRNRVANRNISQRAKDRLFSFRSRLINFRAVHRRRGGG